MNSSYYFQICAFIYMVLIMILFFTKKKNKTAENIIFSHLILIGILSVISDNVCVFFSNVAPDTEYYFYSYKLYLIFIVYFILVFTEYTLMLPISNLDNETRLKKQNKICNGVMVFMIIWAIIIMYIDPYYEMKMLNNLNYDIITYLTIGLALLCIVLWTTILIFNFKKLSSRKLVPITVIIVFGVLAASIEYLSNLHLIVPTFVFSIFTLYVTIFPLENPDLEKIKELEEAKAEADKSNQSKTEYLSNVSHEIRTPLNAILGFSQGLLEEEISDEVREEVEDIVNASDILLEIVNEILDISKIESNKLEIVNVDYDVQKIYKSLVSMTEGRIGSRQLQFIHNYSNNMPDVLKGDFARIKQITVNLISNAIKYTKDGFIRLSFNCELKENNICCLIISVTDSGMGIKEENIDKIFSKFDGLQLQKEVTVEGTGLGLSLTKKLVDMMGGKIVVQSKYGEGSTFTVYLDQEVSSKTLEELEAESPTSSKYDFVGHGQKVLIVDDNSVNLKVALRLMKDYNLNIETLTSGKECIDKINSGAIYDLVMLDDMMPELSGVETLNILKNNIRYNTPTIALTANAISGMKEKYLAEGFNDYLAKPINKVLLEDILVKYLGNDSSVSHADETETSKELVDEPTVEINIGQQESPKVEEKLNKDFLIQNSVDLDKAMELLGDMEMYNDTVKDFVEEIDTKLADIEKFKNAQDMPNYAIQVHSLKSDSKYLGLMKLAELAYNHEMASKGNDVAYVNSHYDELMQEANKMVDIIKRYNG